MSKLYEQYLKLKNENPKKLYLFKSGLFYIALEDDAVALSDKFKLNNKFRKYYFKMRFSRKQT